MSALVREYTVLIAVTTKLHYWHKRTITIWLIVLFRCIIGTEYHNSVDRIGAPYIVSLLWLWVQLLHINPGGRLRRYVEGQVALLHTLIVKATGNRVVDELAKRGIDILSSLTL